MQFIDLKKQYVALGEKINNNIKKVLTEGSYIGGEEVKQLEYNLAAYCGTKYCLTVANGTDALTLALRVFDIKQGDAVFVPSFTFFATAEVVSLERATPIFIDVNERTFNIDTIKLENAIKKVIFQGKLTPKAIIAVDLFGLPADYPEIRRIADKYGLKLIEDAAQGFGGSIDGKRACSFGDISTTSFFPAKPLGCYGDGGAIFTDNEEYFKMLQSLAVHGKGAYKYDNVRIGYNSRLDTLQASILLAKLEAFEIYELDARNLVAKKYTDALKSSILIPQISEGYGSSWAQYTLILKNSNARDAMQAKLKEKGIPSMIYYPVPMHKQTAYKGYEFNLEELKVSEMLAACVLSIPMHPYLEDAEQRYIIDCVLE